MTQAVSGRVLRMQRLAQQLRLKVPRLRLPRLRPELQTLDCDSRLRLYFPIPADCAPF